MVYTINDMNTNEEQEKRTNTDSKPHNGQVHFVSIFKLEINYFISVFSLRGLCNFFVCLNL